MPLSRMRLIVVQVRSVWRLQSHCGFIPQQGLQNFNLNHTNEVNPDLTFRGSDLLTYKTHDLINIKNNLRQDQFGGSGRSTDIIDENKSDGRINQLTMKAFLFKSQLGGCNGCQGGLGGGASVLGFTETGAADLMFSENSWLLKCIGIDDARASLTRHGVSRQSRITS